MTKIKFDKCFTGNEVVSLEDIVTSNGRLRREYNPDALYCPLCKKARLKFTSATSQRVAYLSTWPGSIHEDGCRYAFEPMPKRETISYYKKIEGDTKQLKSILEAHLQHSLHQQNRSIQELRSKTALSDPLIVERAKDGTNSKFFLPSRSIKYVRNTTADFREIPILFSGLVKIRIKTYLNADGIECCEIDLLNPTSEKLYMHFRKGRAEYLPKALVSGETYWFDFFGVYSKDINKAYPSIYPPNSYIYGFLPTD